AAVAADRRANRINDNCSFHGSSSRPNQISTAYTDFSKGIAELAHEDNELEPTVNKPKEPPKEALFFSPDGYGQFRTRGDGDLIVIRIRFGPRARIHRQVITRGFVIGPSHRNHSSFCGVASLCDESNRLL